MKKSFFILTFSFALLLTFFYGSYNRPIAEGNLSYRELLARGYAYRGEYSEVNKLLAGQALSGQGVSMLVRAQLALGHKESARALINKYSGVEWARLYAFYLAAEGNYRGAEEILKEVLSGQNGDRELQQLELAEVLSQQRKTAEARQVVAKLAGSLNPAVYVVEGDMALRVKDYPGAWQKYNRARQLGYLSQDPMFLTKFGLAALGAGKDYVGIAAEIKNLDLYKGLGYYLEAQGSLRQGDLRGTLKSLQAALNGDLPGAVRPAVQSLAAEVAARLKAEPALQAIIAQGGH